LLTTVKNRGRERDWREHSGRPRLLKIKPHATHVLKKIIDEV
jgi:hypothetical protein